MSRTLETHPGELRCSNPKCTRFNPLLAKANGIKCRCGAVTELPPHFYPAHAIAGGAIEADLQEHLRRAWLVGCETCGIKPAWTLGPTGIDDAKTIHFYPASAIAGGSIDLDWRRHFDEAKISGCRICGIVPEQPLIGKTTDERYAELQARLHAVGGPPRTSGTAELSKHVEVKSAAVATDEPVAKAIGSHGLAARYTAVPATLETTGMDYKLPEFAPADAQWLAGARVLIICADGPELPELDVPMEYLRARGAQVVLAGQDWIFQWRDPAGYIVVAQWLSDGICVKADVRLSDVRLEDFDAVFIAGGAWNPDMLRTDDVALRLVRQAHAQGLLVVSLCHGPQVLISAAFDAPEGQENFPSRGIHITGTVSIRRDLTNAGFVVHTGDATVYDKQANLLTARDPNDLGPLCEHFGTLLHERLATAPVTL